MKTVDMATMTTSELEARIAQLRAERVLVATNDGTHGLPPDTHTWRRYATVVDEYVDNPRAFRRDAGNARTFPRAWERVRELRAEYRALAAERDRRAARER